MAVLHGILKYIALHFLRKDSVSMLVPQESQVGEAGVVAGSWSFLRPPSSQLFSIGFQASSFGLTMWPLLVTSSHGFSP
jgi:hypothetical protein